MAIQRFRIIALRLAKQGACLELGRTATLDSSSRLFRMTSISSSLPTVGSSARLTSRLGFKNLPQYIFAVSGILPACHARSPLNGGGFLFRGKITRSSDMSTG
jgi:hypothetical protein